MQIPFFRQIEEAKTILLAGAGGFDITSGIPLYFGLRKLGKKVILANLSFTELRSTSSQQICWGTYRITQDSFTLPYFPEKHILEWLYQKNEYPEMYAFSNGLGVQPLHAAYATIIEKHGIDTLILIDAGTDCLMFGDESKVGTIIEDSCSILAASKVPVPRRFVTAIGFGVEHDLNHHACLENIASLTKEGDYLGAFSLTKEMEEAQTYQELVAYLNQNMSPYTSIVTNSIVSSLQGEFGDFHPTSRTKSTIQFINPFMSLYWFFHLEGIAKKMKFSEDIEKSQTMNDVLQGYRKYRIMNPRRPNQTIPLK